MKLIIIKSNLREGLLALERATAEHQNLPILKNVLIEAQGNGIKLTTTNLEIAITTSVSGKVIEAGKITVPLDLFLNIINNLQSERLNIEYKNPLVEIKTDNYEATLQATPADDFPIIPKIKNQDTSIEIQSDILREALIQVAPSAQFSELRPELSSVFFSFLLDHIKLAATDSFRLAEKTIPKTHLLKAPEEAFKILIPLKTVHELIRILKNNAPIKISRDENQVLFSSDQFELVSRLIDANFPDYEYLIPKTFDTKTTLNREEFLNAIKLVSVFSAKVHEIKLRLPEDRRYIEVFSGDRALGENKYLLPVKADGSSREASFNWRYLTDGLKAIPTESVFMGLNEDNKPAVIKSPNDASYFYILMPILKV